MKVEENITSGVRKKILYHCLKCDAKLILRGEYIKDNYETSFKSCTCGNSTDVQATILTR